MPKKAKAEDPNVRACSSCGARILWAKTQADKPIPLDYPGEGRLIIVNGRVDRAVTYVAHIATCPWADSRRKRG